MIVIECGPVQRAFDQIERLDSNATATILAAAVALEVGAGHLRLS